MNVGRSFTFVADDRDWAIKVLIGGGILLLGVFFFWLLLIPLIAAVALLFGYSLEITRRVIRGDPQLMPEWKDLSTLIADGLRVLAVVLVYGLPILAAGLCLGAPADLLAKSDSSAALSLGSFFSGLFTLITVLWSLVMAFLLPAAIGRLADTGQIAPALRFGEVIHLVRGHFSTYLVTVLMTWVALFVAGLGKLLCVGWLATVPYAHMVIGHLYGQAYVVARE